MLGLGVLTMRLPRQFRAFSVQCSGLRDVSFVRVDVLNRRLPQRRWVVVKHTCVCRDMFGDRRNRRSICGFASTPPDFKPFS